jgi:NAD-dependent DNA ligase
MNISAPTTCPSCTSKLERVKDQLFCRNGEDCPAQSTKRLQNFCKKLKIKGFGEATLGTLGFTKFNDILAFTPDDALKQGLSAHMAGKLYDTVTEVTSSGISPNDFLAAMSIPLIGDGAMRKLSFDSVESITYDMCKTSGIGDKAARNLLDWIESNEDIISRWSVFFKTIKSQTSNAESNGNVVCITGKLTDFKNRTEAGTYLASLGFEVKTSVTKLVTHLICEDGSTGSSYKKAINNGIPVITIKELLEDK